MSSRPLVSILTPVFNGGRYLGEAIESVLSQSYTHWCYLIVNNCSTDDTLAVAERYARKDSRITVVTNDSFVNCESNHNNAFRRISPDCRYCKVISADDWLLPGALERFVDFALEHPTVGIVGSYQQSGDTVRWKGLSPDTSVISGREVCRRTLLEELQVFGNPTSLLYRSDLVRRAESFFPHDRPYADTSACYANLHDCDFGFIHEVLTVERVHAERVSVRAQLLDTGVLALLETVIEHGPAYLTQSELRVLRARVEAAYYRTLTRGLLRLKGRSYLEFHDAGLRGMGLRLSKSRIAASAVGIAATKLLRPFASPGKLGSALDAHKKGRASLSS